MPGWPIIFFAEKPYTETRDKSILIVFVYNLSFYRLLSTFLSFYHNPNFIIHKNNQNQEPSLYFGVL